MLVLQVEDCAAHARLVAHLLKWTPGGGDALVLRVAERLGEAIELLRGQRFDAVLLDLSLPDAEGLAALERLRAIAPEVPIVVLTASGDEQLAVRAVHAGAQDYLFKGTATGELLVRALRYAVERAAAARELRQSDELFRMGFDAAPIGVALAGPDGALLRANRAFREMLGYTAGAGEGGAGPELHPLPPLRQLTHPEDWPATEANLRAALEGRTDGYRYEKRFLRRDRTVVWADVSVSVVRGPDGRPSLLIGQVQDVTERRQTERALRDAQEQLRLAMDAARMGCWTWEPRSGETIWSETLEPLFGLAPGTFEGTYADFLARVHPEDQDRVNDELIEAVRGRGRVDSEFRVVLPDGSVRWIAEKGRVVEDASAAGTLHVVGMDVDVTDRKLAEQELRRQNELLKAIFDRMPAMLVQFGPDGRIRMANPEWERVLGWSAAEAAAERDLMAAFYPDPDQRRRAVEFIARADGAWGGFETRTRDGRAIHMSWANVRLSDGTTIGIGKDVTDRRRAEAVERERAALTGSVRAMEQVLGVVGHELRTPLAGLRAMSEFCLSAEARQTESFNRFLSEINGEVVRMSETVNDLLEAARLNSGLARWQWELVPLRRVCRDAVAPLRPLAAAAGVALSLDVAPRDLVMKGDAEAVRRLVRNLVSNAVKHTDRGSITLTVRHAADARGRWVELAVCDTGRGIPPDVLDRLGEAFALNGGVIGMPHVGGAGLGLAICRGIARAHGGTIRVASTVGRGTLVCVRLRADLPEPCCFAGKGVVDPAAGGAHPPILKEALRARPRQRRRWRRQPRRS